MGVFGTSFLDMPFFSCSFELTNAICFRSNMFKTIRFVLYRSKPLQIWDKKGMFFGPVESLNAAVNLAAHPDSKFIFCICSLYALTLPSIPNPPSCFVYKFLQSGMVTLRESQTLIFNHRCWRSWVPTSARRLSSAQQTPRRLLVSSFPFWS